MKLSKALEQLKEKGCRIELGHTYYCGDNYSIAMWYEGRYVSTGSSCYATEEGQRLLDTVLPQLERIDREIELHAYIRKQGLSNKTLTSLIKKYGDRLVYKYDLLGVLNNFKIVDGYGFRCLDTDEETPIKFKSIKDLDLEVEGFEVWD